MNPDAADGDELDEADDSAEAEASNGEVARAGEYQVTEAEREADKDLRSARDFARDFAREEWPFGAVRLMS